MVTFLWQNSINLVFPCSQFPHQLSSIWDEFFLMEWALNPVRYCWLVPYFVPPLHKHVMQVGHHYRSMVFAFLVW